MVYPRERNILPLNWGLGAQQIRSRRFGGDESLLHLPVFERLTVQLVSAVFYSNTVPQ